MVSLAQAERIAIENSPILAPAAAQVDVAEARAAQAASARFLPSLNLRNVWGPIPRQRGEFNEFGVLTSPDSITRLRDIRWFTDVQLQLLQPIYAFGKTRSIREAAAAGVTAEESNLANRTQEVRLTVRRLFWSLVLARDLQAAARSVQGDVSEFGEILEERFETGEATQNDMFRFQIFQYEVNKRYREAAAGVERARAGLRAAIGLPDGTLLRPEPEALEPEQVEVESLETYQARARRSRPELAQLRAGIDARNHLAESERADLRPRFFVAAEFRANYAPSRFDPRNPFWRNETNFVRPSILFGIDWNLNLFQSRHEARVNELEARRLRVQESPLLEQIGQEVREAYLKLVRTEQDVEEGRAALQAGENWFRAEAQVFEMGIGDIEDLTEAFVAHVEMRAEHLEKIFEFNTAVAELSRAVGSDLRRAAPEDPGSDPSP